MNDTRERILDTALRLFARDGYEAVSVSMIAGELGISKGAMYRHFENKREVFDCIVQRMYETDAERAREYGVPEDAEGSAPTSPENVKSFALAQFRFWTEDPFASNFRKMLVLEQYRSEEAAGLYRDCLTAGPVEYMQGIFAKMAENGLIECRDAYLLATEFYAPMFLLISASDSSPDKAPYAAVLRAHIDEFFKEKLI